MAAVLLSVRGRVSIALPSHSPRFQYISDPAHIVNQRRIERFINLGAQTAHGRFNDIRAGIKVDIPNLFYDPGAGDDFPGRLRQAIQQHEFASGEIETSVQLALLYTAENQSPDRQL